MRELPVPHGLIWGQHIALPYENNLCALLAPQRRTHQASGHPHVGMVRIFPLLFQSGRRVLSIHWLGEHRPSLLGSEAYRAKQLCGDMQALHIRLSEIFYHDLPIITQLILCYLLK